jgi:hypothetical protein
VHKVVVVVDHGVPVPGENNIKFDPMSTGFYAFLVCRKTILKGFFIVSAMGYDEHSEMVP